MQLDVKYYIETYGCSLNDADSDVIAGVLNSMGAQQVFNQEDAEVIIVNTCGVKEPTEDRIIHRLKELSQIGTPVIATGCLPKISLKRIKRAIPNFAAIHTPQSIHSIPFSLRAIMDGKRGIVKLGSSKDTPKIDSLCLPPNSVICTIPICEGCLGNCAYCAVKFARGHVRSYSIEKIVKLAQKCIKRGYCEIRLTSQDSGVYGHDRGTNLLQLLQKLDTLSGNHRFRLGMFNPNLVSLFLDDMTRVMASDHYFNFFHMPLQSGSNEVLARMNRRYTVEEWGNAVERIRKQIPLATIATDVIAGFPGETDNDFHDTLAALKQYRPALVNISKYGDRPNTKASMSDQKVDTQVKKQRSRKLTNLVARLNLANHRAWVDWTGPVIVTQYGSKGGLMGRNPSYVPVILHNENIDIGETVKVKITKAHRTYLSGNVITSDQY
ncbi:MAG: tRNA (N(6)-L-threonylcarbamoyladenosine(37)-C(2))-methylthiotransferase [Candidatus Thorarchaeota archaeon]|nr:tRNA (N(6)-L-threonylcarbamoyladenosine(37)-C(2))-methylthiotransferase [Candidatus Thorarchaeota archaeon]